MTTLDATYVPLKPRYLVLKVTAGLLVALKLCSLLFVNLVSDEAYYWMWGQHPALSYFDHPPLNAWLIAVADLLFGRGLFQMRMWAILTFIGTVWILRIWAQRLGEAGWEGLFWRSLVILLAAPVFGVYPTYATSDHLLFFIVLLSGHFLVSYLAEVREGRPGRLRDLYLGAAAMGLMALSKYNALFFGVALGLYIVASPRLRRLLGNPHLYLAALVTIVIASPVLIWNLTHGFASFEFHLVERHDAGFMHRITGQYLVEFLIQTLLTLSPFMMWGMVRFIAQPPSSPFGRTAWGLSNWFLALSTGAFVFVGLTQQLFFWWNASAYVLMLPFLGQYMRNRWVFWGHLTLAALLSVFYVYSSSIFPLLNYIDRPDPTRERYYGWNEIAGPLEAAIAKYQPDFIASSKWESASVTGFALDDPDVVAINPRPNEYHYWFDKAAREARRGQNALVVVQNGMEKGVLDPQFEKLTPIEDIPITRQGKKMTSYQLYWGEGYRPSY
jgi:hypothetical protein